MRCQRCQGTGTEEQVDPNYPGHLLFADPREAYQQLPCTRCGGTGIDHCCDGITCQPGAPEEAAE